MTQTHSFMHWMSTGFQVWTNSIQKWRTMKTKVSEECVLSGSCAWHLTLHTHRGCRLHHAYLVSHSQLRTALLSPDKPLHWNSVQNPLPYITPGPSLLSSENSVHPEPFVPGCPGTHTADKTHSLIRKQDKILSMTSVL